MTAHTRPTHGDSFISGATDAATVIDAIWDEIEALQATVEVQTDKQVANGYAGLDGNGDVIGAATAADLAVLRGLITALTARVTTLENAGGGGGGGGGGGTNAQVVPMGVYSSSDASWNRTVALVGDARWTVPLVRWFSDMGSDLSTAKADIDSSTRTLLINLPSRNGGTTYPWTTITAGTHDAELVAWFTALGTFVSPNIYVTFVDEPDGTTNGAGQPASSYFPAFDHVKTIANANAPNVKLGLGLAQATGSGRGIAVWDHANYDFIDWHPYNRNSPWISFASIMQRDYPAMASYAGSRPVLMTTGCVENPNDPSGPNSKKAWYVNLGNTLLTANAQYPKLAGVWVWDSGSSPDFHVDTSTDSLNGFKTLVATDFTAATPPSSITVNNLLTKGVSTASGTTVAATVPTAVPTGHHVIVITRGNGNPTTVTITDSRSNTWQTDQMAQQTGAAKSFVCITSAKVTTQLQVGDTITATLGAAATNKDIVGICVTGLNATTWVDKVATANGNSAVVDSGATAATAGAALIVGGATLALPLPLDAVDDGNGHALTVIDSSQITGTNNRAVSAGYAIAPGAETAHAAFNSHGNSGYWVASVVGYKA